MDYYDAPRIVQRSTSGSGSFQRFSIPGWLLIIVGIVCLVLGCVDIAWTVSKYGDACSVAPTAFYDPCDANHIYTYISAPVWGGLIMVGAGLAAIMMTRRRLLGGSGMLYYVFVGLCLLVIMLAAPAIVVLMALELALNDETFYNSDVAGTLATMDDLKFALPVTLAVLGFVGFCVAIAAAMVACFCRPNMGGDYGGDYGGGYGGGYGGDYGGGYGGDYGGGYGGYGRGNGGDYGRGYGDEMMSYTSRPRERVMVIDEPRYDVAPARREVIPRRMEVIPRSREVITQEPRFRASTVIDRVVSRPYRTSMDREYGDVGSYGNYGPPFDYRRTRSLRPIRY